MNEQEVKARQEFFRQTGKTPEDEARDSAHGLAMVLLVVLGSICFGLPIYLAFH